MKGFRVIKNYWPKPKMLAWRDNIDRLPTLLSPLAKQLDDCWWYIGGQGVDTSGTTSEQEINALITPGGIAGRPGFFSRFGNGLGSDWKTYFAVDQPNDPMKIFTSFDRYENKWFDQPELVPAAVCLLIRGVDALYWDLLFRDDWMFNEIKNHLANREYLQVDEG